MNKLQKQQQPQPQNQQFQQPRPQHLDQQQLSQMNNLQQQQPSPPPPPPPPPQYPQMNQFQKQQQQPQLQQLQHQKEFSSSPEEKSLRMNSASLQKSQTVVDSSNLCFCPVKSLHPYNKDWMIKVRVISKNDLCEYNYANNSRKGHFFRVNLIDAEGSCIRATLFNDVADRFVNYLTIGQAYLISKGTVKPSTKRFRGGIDYELTFDTSASIQLCDPENSTEIPFPSIRQQFVPIQSISDIESDQFIDVIGIAISIGELSTVVHKNHREVNRRKITLLDNSESTIELTIWSSASEHPTFTQDEKPILAFRDVKVSDYNAKSLSFISSSSMIEVNPDLPEAHFLRHWYNTGGYSVIPRSLTKRKIENISARRKMISEVLLDAENDSVNEIIELIGVITQINQSRLWYTACTSPNCFKKIHLLDDGKWHCDKCGVIDGTQLRYMIPLRVSDPSGEIFLSCFNDIGIKLFGMDANSLAREQEKDSVSFEHLLQDATLKLFQLYIKLKRITYQDQDKSQINVVSMVPVDFVRQSKWLIHQIQSLQKQ